MFDDVQHKTEITYEHHQTSLTRLPKVLQLRPGPEADAGPQHPHLPHRGQPGRLHHGDPPHPQLRVPGRHVSDV